MIEIRLHGVDNLLQRLDPRMVNKAIRMSVTETAKAAKAETSERIRAKWNIKKRDLERKFTIRSGWSGFSKTLTIAGDPIGLSYFGAREVRLSRSGVITRKRGKDGSLKTKTGRRTRQQLGVSVEIEKGKRTVLQRSWITNARSFAGSMKGGARGGEGVLYGERRARVLSRMKDGKRRDIWGPKSISVPSMFRQGKIERAVTDKATDVFNTRFRYHIKRLMDAAGPSVG